MKAPLFSLLLVTMFSGVTLSADDTQDTPANLVPFNVLDAWAYRPESIKMIMRSVAEYQLADYGEMPGPGWTTGTFFSSFVSAYQATRDRWYLQQAQRWAAHVEWQIRNPVHADELCPAQTYLDLHFVENDSHALAALDAVLREAYFDREQLRPGELQDWDSKSYEFRGARLWSWADALYMAPPVLARMARATGDARYYEVLHELYWDAVAALYDDEAQLFFRDAKEDAAQVLSPSGSKVFWSRGMGWVISGLARMIDYLEPEDPERERYLDLFRTLAYSLPRYQQSDGLWRSALIEPEWYPTKETSGTAFFTFAIAKGINEGWLPRAYFLPIVLKAWSGLTASVQPSGKVGYSQIVAGSPHEVRPGDSVDYTAGALLLAAAEIYKLGALEYMRSLSERDFQPRLVAADAHWLESGNDRVFRQKAVWYSLYTLQQGHSAIGAFASDDWPRVSAYARKQKLLHPAPFAAASLGVLSEERLLLLTSGVDSSQRFIDLPLWDEMKIRKTTTLAPEARRWLNIQKLDAEPGRTLMFYLGEAGPMLNISPDDAQSWEPAKPIFGGLNVEAQTASLHVASDSRDRIDLLLSLAREQGTELYHFYYRNGAFFSRDGRTLGSLEDVPNFADVQGELRVPEEVATPRAHVEDFEHSGGQLFIAISEQDQAKTDLVRLALSKEYRWRRELMLTLPARDATQGLSLSPQRSDVAMVASRLHPTSGEVLPNGRYQLFKVQLVDGLWHWRQLSFDVVRDQVQPELVRGRHSALFWLSQIPSTSSGQVESSTLLMTEAF